MKYLGRRDPESGRRKELLVRTHLFLGSRGPAAGRDLGSYASQKKSFGQ